MTNPMVPYLASLRTQEGQANPSYVEENRQEFLHQLRGRHSWFPGDADLHVATRTDRLAAEMAEPNFPLDLVFLTGDAGDGKTAACVQFAQRAGFSGILAPRTEVGGWVVVKDASEVPETELLHDVTACLAGSTRLVVAINEGRLRRIARAPELRGLWAEVIERALQGWIGEDEAVELDAAMRRLRVGVVNFRHRMHVRAVVPGLLSAWTNAAWWEGSPTCGECPAAGSCPILANVVSLRSPSAVGHVADVLTAVHFAGQRLPFRRLQAVLALTVTGGQNCQGVQAPGFTPELRMRFYEALFLRKTAGGVRPEPVARALAFADSAEQGDVSLDAAVTRWLSGDGRDELPAFENAVLARHAGSSSARALRRLRSLLCGTPSASWHRALRLMEDYAREGKSEARLREEVVAALNHLHRHEGTQRDVLTRWQLDPVAFREPARPAPELDLQVAFEVSLVRGPVLPPQLAPWLESSASDLELRAWPQASAAPVSPARLALDARLIALLLEVNAGYRFVPALGSYRRELARFFARLASLAADSPASVTLRDGTHSWRVDAAGDRLRFEARS